MTHEQQTPDDSPQGQMSTFVKAILGAPEQAGESLKTLSGLSDEIIRAVVSRSDELYRSALSRGGDIFFPATAEFNGMSPVEWVVSQVHTQAGALPALVGVGLREWPLVRKTGTPRSEHSAKTLLRAVDEIFSNPYDHRLGRHSMSTEISWALDRLAECVDARSPEISRGYWELVDKHANGGDLSPTEHIVMRERGIALARKYVLAAGDAPGGLRQWESILSRQVVTKLKPKGGGSLGYAPVREPFLSVVFSTVQLHTGTFNTDACDSQCANMLRRAFAAGLSPDFTVAGAPLLAWAAEHGLSASVAACLEAGADPFGKISDYAALPKLERATTPVTNVIEYVNNAPVRRAVAEVIRAAAAKAGVPPRSSPGSHCE